MKKLDVKANAKINLALDVIGKRPDGYHEISTVMQQISLCDDVCVKWIPGQTRGIEIETESNRNYLPRDIRNTAYKAAELLVRRFDIEKRLGPGKVRIDIKKRIPVAAGLGGGSADGAAVLQALSDIWELGLSNEQLCEIGSSIGADVAFCVMGFAGIRCALGTGIGDILTPVAGMDCWIVLSRPRISVSTADAYRGFSQLGGKILKRPDIQALTEALKKNNITAASENMINVLENYTLATHPKVAGTKEKMIDRTAPQKALMSGSGPTIIGFYRDKTDAEAAYEKMAAINRETFLARTLV